MSSASRFPLPDDVSATSLKELSRGVPSETQEDVESDIINLNLKPAKAKFEATHRSFWSIGGEGRSFQSVGNSVRKTGNPMHDELHSNIKEYIIAKLESQTWIPEGIYTKEELETVCDALEKEYAGTYLASAIHPMKYEYCQYDMEWSVTWAIGDNMIEGQVGKESGVLHAKHQKVGTGGKRSLLARLLKGPANSGSTQ